MVCLHVRSTRRSSLTRVRAHGFRLVRLVPSAGLNEKSTPALCSCCSSAGISHWTVSTGLLEDGVDTYVKLWSDYGKACSSCEDTILFSKARRLYYLGAIPRYI